MKKVDWNKIIGITIIIVFFIFLAIIYINSEETRTLIGILSAALMLLNLNEKIFPSRNKEIIEINQKLDLIIMQNEHREKNIELLEKIVK